MLHSGVLRVTIIVLAVIAAIFIAIWLSVWVAAFLSWVISSILGAFHSIFGGIRPGSLNFRYFFRFSPDPRVNEFALFCVTLCLILAVIKFLTGRGGKK